MHNCTRTSATLAEVVVTQLRSMFGGDPDQDLSLLERGSVNVLTYDFRNTRASGASGVTSLKSSHMSTGDSDLMVCC